MIIFKKSTLALTRTYKQISTRCNSTKAQSKALKMLDDVYHELVAQKFGKIVVIQTKFNADPRYLVLANAFNNRHLTNGTGMLNKFFKSSIKDDQDEFARLSISHEWNVIDLNSVIVHLFLKECREQYDIEQLWAVGEKYDKFLNEHFARQLKAEEQPAEDSQTN